MKAKMIFTGGISLAKLHNIWTSEEIAEIEAAFDEIQVLERIVERVSLRVQALEQQVLDQKAEIGNHEDREARRIDRRVNARLRMANKALDPIEEASLHAIADAVAKVTKVSKKDMRSTCRKGAFVRARRIFMVLAWQEFKICTCVKAGEFCEGRDHSTVNHAWNKHLENKDKSYTAAYKKCHEEAAAEISALIARANDVEDAA